MNIKVNKNKLEAAIKAKRDSVEKSSAPIIAQINKDFEKYKEKRLLELAEDIKKIKASKGFNFDLPSSSNNFGFYARVAVPNVAKYDEALAKLALTDEEVITLNDRTNTEFLSLI